VSPLAGWAGITFVDEREVQKFRVLANLWAPMWASLEVFLLFKFTFTCFVWRPPVLCPKIGLDKGGLLLKLLWKVLKHGIWIYMMLFSVWKVLEQDWI
jgi:hypothetical protein